MNKPLLSVVDAVLSRDVFPDDDEFDTIFGYTREEYATLRDAIVRGNEEACGEMQSMLDAAIVNLAGYPHQNWPAVEKLTGVSPRTGDPGSALRRLVGASTDLNPSIKESGEPFYPADGSSTVDEVIGEYMVFVANRPAGFAFSYVDEFDSGAPHSIDEQAKAIIGHVARLLDTRAVVSQQDLADSLHNAYPDLSMVAFERLVWLVERQQAGTE